MGLDTSHDCWHGSYLLFEAFRRRLQIAMALDYYGRYQGEMPPVEVFRAEPLAVLLLHSDHDGSIAWADTERLADRLEALAPLVAQLPEVPGDQQTWLKETGELAARGIGPSDWPEMPGLSPEWYVKRTLAFARGLRLARERGEDVTFG